MPRKYFRKYLPDHETIREHRHLRWFRPLLKHPNLWHLNRHSVAGGVAVGMFGGLIPGPVQMLTAAVLAIVFRVNLPVAVFATLYTNPITWGPLILAAYAIGSWVTGGNHRLAIACTGVFFLVALGFLAFVNDGRGREAAVAA